VHGASGKKKKVNREKKIECVAAKLQPDAFFRYFLPVTPYALFE
jgi:hypothetical protein